MGKKWEEKAPQREAENPQGGPTKGGGMDEKQMMDAYNTYKNHSPDQMQEELFRLAAKEIEEGTFSPSQMDDFFRAVSPMLPKEQQGRMRELIDTLKKKADA